MIVSLFDNSIVCFSMESDLTFHNLFLTYPVSTQMKKVHVTNKKL